MSKKSYIVTDKGGPRPDIAGARRAVGDRISLTKAEAEFELLRGTITLASDVVEEQPVPAAKKRT